MARPGRFEWDDHNWSGTPHPHESPNEQRTDPSTVHRDGNVASGETQAG
jgi:putative transposase